MSTFPLIAKLELIHKMAAEEQARKKKGKYTCTLCQQRISDLIRWLDIVMLTNTLNKNGVRQIEVFTTNSYVKHRMLHVIRDADDISRVKTGELHPDVLIADVIKKKILENECAISPYFVR